MRIACIFGTSPGIGGLGMQADNVLSSLALIGSAQVLALGPAPDRHARCALSANVRWVVPPNQPWLEVAGAVPGLRARSGALARARAGAHGRWAADRLEEAPPDLCYAFTHVARESFEVCARRGIPSILESPNGHLDQFRRVYVEEQAAWCGGAYHGHPTPGMVSRVAREYELADRIRVSSAWTAESLAGGGVPRDRLRHIEQPVDLRRYRPPATRRPGEGPLRVCFVGSLDLRKGFVYLLDALSALDPSWFRLEMVGATGDRCSRRVLEQRLPVNATCAPGDPREAYSRAEVFVLPTLEDGSPFAAAEAMASGLPVVVTSSCGAAEWVRPETGWVVPARNPQAIQRALLDARSRRGALLEMGRQARADTEARAGEHRYRELAEWVQRYATGSDGVPRSRRRVEGPDD